MKIFLIHQPLDGLLEKMLRSFSEQKLNTPQREMLLRMLKCLLRAVLSDTQVAAPFEQQGKAAALPYLCCLCRESNSVRNAPL